MQFPAKAQLTGTVTWADSTPFDGYILLGLVLPKNSDGAWPTAVIDGIFPALSLPIWTQIPVSAGVIDVNSYVWLNSSISPGNTQYVAYWYDLNKRRLFPASNGTPTPFSINSAAYAITVPSLTVPSTGTTLPSPQDTTTGGA